MTTIDIAPVLPATLRDLNSENNLVTKIAASFVIRPSGFTLTPIEFEYLGDDDTPDIPTGYAVGGILPSVSTVGIDSEYALIRSFVRDYRALAGTINNDLYIGGWQSDNGAQCLDAVMIVPRFDTASRLAKAWRQEAVGRFIFGKYSQTILV